MIGCSCAFSLVMTFCLICHHSRSGTIIVHNLCHFALKLFTCYNLVYLIGNVMLLSNNEVLMSNNVVLLSFNLVLLLYNNLVLFCICVN